VKATQYYDKNTEQREYPSDDNSGGDIDGDNHESGEYFTLVYCGGLVNDEIVHPV
jgi:hypothetical protein